MPRMSPNLASEMEGFTSKYRTKRDIKAGYTPLGIETEIIHSDRQASILNQIGEHRRRVRENFAFHLRLKAGWNVKQQQLIRIRRHENFELYVRLAGLSASGYCTDCSDLNRRQEFLKVLGKHRQRYAGDHLDSGRKVVAEKEDLDAYVISNVNLMQIYSNGGQGHLYLG